MEVAKELDREPGIHDRRHHVSEPVVPETLLGGRLRTGIGVINASLEAQRLTPLEVGVLKRHAAFLGVLGECKSHRMELHHVDDFAGAGDMGHHLFPAGDVWEPVERPVGREYDLIGAQQRLGEVVDVPADERGADIELSGQTAGEIDGRGVEVGRRYHGAEASSASPG